MQKHEFEFSAVITKEDKGYVALAPELDIASQGRSIEEALANLKEAVELYLSDEDVKLSQSKERPLVTLIRVEVNEKSSNNIRKEDG